MSYDPRMKPVDPWRWDPPESTDAEAVFSGSFMRLFVMLLVPTALALYLVYAATVRYAEQRDAIRRVDHEMTVQQEMLNEQHRALDERMKVLKDQQREQKEALRMICLQTAATEVERAGCFR